MCVSLGDLPSVYAVLIIKAEMLLMNRSQGNRLQTLEKHWIKITQLTDKLRYICKYIWCDTYLALHLIIDLFIDQWEIIAGLK